MQYMKNMPLPPYTTAHSHIPSLFSDNLSIFHACVLLHLHLHHFVVHFPRMNIPVWYFTCYCMLPYAFLGILNHLSGLFMGWTLLRAIFWFIFVFYTCLSCILHTYDCGFYRHFAFVRLVIFIGMHVPYVRLRFDLFFLFYFWFHLSFIFL